MLDPFSVAVMLAIGGVIGGAIYVAFLTMEFLIDWFRDRAAAIQTNPDALAVTVAQELSSGRVNYVQGIFDQSKGTFSEARKVKTDSADSQVRQAHTGSPVAVWS